MSGAVGFPLKVEKLPLNNSDPPGSITHMETQTSELRAGSAKPGSS